VQWDIRKFLPFESHFLEIEGHRLHYFDESPPGRVRDEAIILLHGNPTWSFYYRKLIARLKDSFRVVAPDYIGCGLSDHPVGVHFRAADRVRHLRILLKHLGLKSFSLVMHDWGGPLGSSLAVENISAVRKLVYLNTTLTETDGLPGIIRLAASPLVGRVLTKYSMQFLKMMVVFGVSRRLSREVRQGYFHPYRTSSRRGAIWDFVADVPFSNDHPSYAAMLSMAEKLPCLRNVPVLIIWGLKDPCFHREMLSQVAGHFPQAKVLEIPEASHLVLEDAAEKVCEAIFEFFSKNEAAVVDDNVKSRRWRVVKDADAENSPAQGGLFGSFVKNARLFAEQDALIIPCFDKGGLVSRFIGLQSASEDTLTYRHVSFASLFSLVNKYQRGMTELGLRAGDRVLMLVPPGVDFLACAYAVMGRGALPVLVDPGIGLENMLKCVTDSAPQALIGTAKAQLLRFFKPGLFRKLKFSLCTAGISPGCMALSVLKKFAAAPLTDVEVQARQGILVAYTSGATGTPKGVVFTREMVEEQLRIFRDVFGIQAGEKDLPLLPAFSLFGLALGVCTVCPPLDPARPLDVDPSRVIRVIQELAVAYSFGSPTLWGKIAEYAVCREVVLSSLRKVFMAGCAVPDVVIERVRRAAPRAGVYTPYGATEVLPVTLGDVSELMQYELKPALSGEMGTPVGRPVAGLEVKIIRPILQGLGEKREVSELPARHIGEILAKGVNVSPLYLNRPDATKAAKLQEVGGFWHRLGDVGYLDENGMLYYCGRLSHVVHCRGRVYYSVPVERIFDKHPKVRRSALVELYQGKDVGVVVEPFPQFWPDGEEARNNFIEELRTLARSNPLTASIDKFFFHPSFPVDARHNAKIFREQLGAWASGAA